MCVKNFTIIFQILDNFNFSNKKNKNIKNNNLYINYIYKLVYF